MEPKITKSRSNSRAKVSFKVLKEEEAQENEVDPPVLIYHDIKLALSDVKALKTNDWITDQIISFYFQFMEVNDCYDRKQIQLISPQITQLLKMCQGRPEDAKTHLDSLDSHSKRFLFFPVNDATEQREGSHWSLIVFSKVERIFFSFDSLNQQNNSAAEALCDVLRVALSCPSAFTISFPTLRQHNFHDCGIHVLCNTENIICHLNKRGSVSSVPNLNPDHVYNKRKHILEVIQILGGDV